jgi:hypothetical protein
MKINFVVKNDVYIMYTSFLHDTLRIEKRRPRGQGVDTNYYTFVLPSMDGYL